MEPESELYGIRILHFRAGEIELFQTMINVGVDMIAAVGLTLTRFDSLEHVIG